MSLRRGSVKGRVYNPGTWWALFTSGTTVVALSLAEYYLRPHLISPLCFFMGIAAGISSFALRAWAARYLGVFWSMHIELREGHPLVEKGPYGLVRHPIYLAAVLELLGAVLLLESWWGLVGALVLFAPALVFRIVLEEQAMIAHFGDHYRTYMTTTPAIVPFRLDRRKGSN